VIYKPIYLQVVTAVREFIQAVDSYNKITHLSAEDKQHLLELQCKSIVTSRGGGGGVCVFVKFFFFVFKCIFVFSSF
jgi:hypothetical protein